MERYPRMDGRRSRAPGHPVRALVLCNGPLHDPTWTARQLSRRPGWLVVAADGGLAHAAKLGIAPHLLIGDLDSAPGRSRDAIPGIRHDPDKDETDLELALAYVAALPTVREIVVVGALGRRIDHQFTNVDIAAALATQGRSVRFLDGSSRVWFVTEGVWLTREPRFDVVSLVPHSERVDGVSTRGLRFALSKETLFRGRGRGVSNFIRGKTARVRVGSGLLLVIETATGGRGR